LGGYDVASKFLDAADASAKGGENTYLREQATARAANATGGRDAFEQLRSPLQALDQKSK